jgi:hypothetical protein
MNDQVRLYDPLFAGHGQQQAAGRHPAFAFVVVKRSLVCSTGFCKTDAALPGILTVSLSCVCGNDSAVWVAV